MAEEEDLDIQTCPKCGCRYCRLNEGIVAWIDDTISDDIVLLGRHTIPIAGITLGKRSEELHSAKDQKMTTMVHKDMPLMPLAWESLMANHSLLRDLDITLDWLTKEIGPRDLAIYLRAKGRMVNEEYLKGGL